jgi:hypothetical protein
VVGQLNLPRRIAVGWSGAAAGAIAAAGASKGGAAARAAAEGAEAAARAPTIASEVAPAVGRLQGLAERLGMDRATVAAQRTANAERTGRTYGALGPSGGDLADLAVGGAVVGLGGLAIGSVVAGVLGDREEEFSKRTAALGERTGRSLLKQLDEQAAAGAKFDFHTEWLRLKLRHDYAGGPDPGPYDQWHRQQLARRYGNQGEGSVADERLRRILETP